MAGNWIVGDRSRLVAVLVATGVLAACAGGSDGRVGTTTDPPPTSGDDPMVADAETVTLTPEGASWFDPEVLVHDGAGWLTWQDGSGGVHLAEVDLADGTIVEGSEVAIADDAAPMMDTFNGPELGLDAGGVSVWYTASTAEGPRVATVAVADDGPADVELLTAAGYVSPLPSRRPDEPTTAVVALRRPPGFGTAVWFDEAAPGETVDLVTIDERDDGDARWVTGTALITVAGELESGATVELVDTATGDVVEVGGDEDGDVDDPYGWVDPVSGEVSVLAVVGGDELVVWDVGESGDSAERLRVASPVDSHPHLGSPEPFVVGGRAWASVTVADEVLTVPGRTDQQVWLVPLDGGAPVRCDDGREGVTTRVDPEVIVTDAQVFVYAYAWDGSTSQVQRCAVDLRGAPAPEPSPRTGGLGAVDPTTTAEGVSAEFGDHLVGSPDGDARGELLVFFPGTGARPDDYETFLDQALDLGYHVVGLAYPNDLSVNFDLCQGSPDPSCAEAARDEVLWGIDADGLPLDVAPADAAMTRLTAVLDDLVESHPGAGWDAYLDEQGEPAWAEIATAGHSQGGGHAAFLARDHELARVVLLDATEPSPWTNEPMDTPADRMWGLAHADEPIVAPIERSWAQLGLPGQVVDIDGGESPWGGSHRLLTSTDECRGDPESRGFHHNCPAVDEFLPEPLSPSLAAAWDLLLTG